MRCVKRRGSAFFSQIQENQKRLTGSRVWFSGDQGKEEEEEEEEQMGAWPQVEQSAEARGGSSGWIKASRRARRARGSGKLILRAKQSPLCCRRRRLLHKYVDVTQKNVKAFYDFLPKPTPPTSLFFMSCVTFPQERWFGCIWLTK